MRTFNVLSYKKQNNSMQTEIVECASICGINVTCDPVDEKNGIGLTFII